MATKKISALPAVATPASTDEFEVNQGGTSKKETRAQIHALESGEILSLPDGAVGTPSLTLGAANSGLFAGGVADIGMTIGGSRLAQFVTGWVIAGGSGTANVPGLLNESASATNPTVLPSTSDTDTGIGWVSADTGALIAGGINIMQFGETGGSTPLMGFFGTAAVAKPSGVAVDAAGIHAALVTLGLIAA